MLQRLGITGGSENIASKRFEEVFPNFFDIQYTSPSNYISEFWERYRIQSNRTANLNVKIFEYLLATLCIREEILPLYLNAKVAFVPNVIYDLMFYTAERGPICWSVKTSLRERYKQADLEAIALKYVHRKALNYLITLDESEAFGVKRKIRTGDVIGLDDVIVATKPEFDNLIQELKVYQFSDPPTVKVIESNQVVTFERVQLIR